MTRGVVNAGLGLWVVLLVGAARATPQAGAGAPSGSAAGTPAAASASAAPTGSGEAPPTPAPSASEAAPAVGTAAAAEAPTVCLPMPRVPSPAVLHAPVSQATPGERLRITAELVSPDRVQKASVQYRVGETWHEVDLLRGEATEHEAWVPAEHVVAPGLAYTIVVQYLDGGSVAAFATREAPHPVQVVESALDVIERARLGRLGGRRSEFTLSGDGVEFGSREANADGTRPEDHYYRIEFGYTYRLLRRVSEISMRLGALRGEAPVPDADVNPAKDDPYQVGLYYAEPGFRVMLAEQLHLDAWFVLGINQRGFGAGLGAAALIGEPYGQHFAMGGESIDGVGARAWIRLQVPLTRSLHLSPILEATEMPSADSFGLRTLGELGWVSDGGLRVAVRGGYQARDFTGGGPAGGATVGYAF